MASHPQRGALIVIGSGPGIGNHVAALFASRGFSRVVLIARNSERLQKDKEMVLDQVGKDSVSVDTIRCDISESSSLSEAIRQIDQLQISTECVFFNAARVAYSKLLEFPAEEIEQDFRVRLFARRYPAHLLTMCAVPRLLDLSAKEASSKPSLLVTNSLVYKDPIPDLFSLCLTKSAQRNLVVSMAKIYNTKGIHVGLISVGGRVETEAKHLNPKNIAERTWGLFDQDRDSWDLEVEILEE